MKRKIRAFPINNLSHGAGGLLAVKAELPDSEETNRYFRATLAMRAPSVIGAVLRNNAAFAEP